MMKLAGMVLVAAATFLGGAAMAQEVSDDIVDATVGSWLIASSDGSTGCRVRLEKEKTIGGRVVVEETPCGTPWHDLIAAWDFTDGGIVFRDATRKPLITFEEQEGGPWRTPLDAAETVYLVPEAGGMDHVPTEKEVLGEWVLSDRSGKSLCGMRFLDAGAAGFEEAKALDLSADCAAKVRKIGISAWEIAEIQLVIIGGEDWVYTMIPDGNGGFASDDGEYRLHRKQ